MPRPSSPVEGKRRTKANRKTRTRLLQASDIYQEYPKHKYHPSLGKDRRTGNWNSRIVHSRAEERELGDGWYDNPGHDFKEGSAIKRSAPPLKKQIQFARTMATAGRLPPAVLVGKGQAKILIGRTWEERRQFLTSARETLTQEHSLKLRIDAILDPVWPENWICLIRGGSLRPGLDARDNGSTRCRESWIHFGLC